MTYVNYVNLTFDQTLCRITHWLCFFESVAGLNPNIDTCFTHMFNVFVYSLEQLPSS